MTIQPSQIQPSENYLERQKNLILKYFPEEEEARELIQEVGRFGEYCIFCPLLKKIIYSDAGTASIVYNLLQKESAEKERWFRSKEQGRDLGETICLNWLKQHAKDWNAFWARTHVFLPVTKNQS